MSCDRYQAFWQDEITAEQFAAHVVDCDDCRQAQALDETIEAAARELPVPTSAPGLWDRIEADLQNEQQAQEAEPSARGTILTGIFSPRQFVAYKIAALFLVAIGLSYLLFLRPVGQGPEPRSLLTYDAFARVEAVEREYEAAIQQLELLADPILAEADTELLLLYRQRLETIDAQIQRCQEALAVDSGNAHIRRYLLTAFQDKQEALTELVTLTEG